MMRGEQILTRVAAGLSYKETADQLNLSPTVVREALHGMASKVDHDLYSKGFTRQKRGKRMESVPPGPEWFRENAHLLFQAIEAKEEREADKAVEPDLIRKYIRFLSNRGYTVYDPAGKAMQ